MSDLLYLPVSIGESLDKLSILDIKLDKIYDSRREHVLLEYNLLYSKLQSYIESNTQYYNILKNVNQYIWELMDLLRDGNENNENYVKICKDTIIANDMRFRIKDKINYMSNSAIKEKKGYKTLRVFIEIEDNHISNNNLKELILYYSIIYDEVYIKSSNKNITDLIKYSFNDENIILEHFNSKFNCNINFNNKLIIKNLIDFKELLKDLNISDDHKKYFFTFPVS